MSRKETKIITVVGARPQFVKAAAVSRAFVKNHVQEYLVHTGQHYDDKLSKCFFEELEIPEPKWNLGVGSGSHSQQLGRMMQGIEEILGREKPVLVLVYGDTNSTLAGALAASKINCPVAHIEAGLRSFNRRMPEEVNRVLTDHLAELLFCPNETAVKNLRLEGIPSKDRSARVFLSGDVMYDAALFARERGKNCGILQKLGLKAKQFFLVTIHRPENMEDPPKFIQLIQTLGRIAQTEAPIFFPLHPRTKSFIEEKCGGVASIQAKNVNLYFCEPLSYFEMQIAESQAALILTDSGGVQKEAFFHGIPCLVLRNETEWVELVQAGCNKIVGTDADSIFEGIKWAKNVNFSNISQKDFFGAGNSAEEIVLRIAEFF